MYLYDFKQLERNNNNKDVRRIFTSLFLVEFNALSQEDINKFYDKLNTLAKSYKEVLHKLLD